MAQAANTAKRMAAIQVRVDSGEPELTATQTRKRRPTRRKMRRRNERTHRWNMLVRFALSSSALGLGLLGWGAAARKLVHSSNTSQTQFDAIIVLGYPATTDGDPSPRELASVNEAVREYERGVAPKLIFTGGAVANQFVEARVMAQAAEAQGIPAAAVLTETQARNTLENACFAVRIMHAHGWQSAEVITNPVHQRRAAMIFSRMPITWRMRAAPQMEPQPAGGDTAEALWEDAKAAHYLVWERWLERCRP